MHPNVYLRTFWRGTFRPEVFVAMSFGDAYLRRFTEVIEPAVGAVTYREKQLRARRVDLSKSGDSILTDIIDGVAHSAMILADVSVIGHDSKTGDPYRNGNVMYEVGLALACRQPGEVLLVRDDKAPFLFDVSTVVRGPIPRRRDHEFPKLRRNLQGSPGEVRRLPRASNTAFRLNACTGPDSW
jgi:hypothetical protein